MYRKILTALAIGMAIMMSSCRTRHQDVNERTEDKSAKASLQGVWIDEDTQEVNFRAKGDTIYYPDSTSMPAYFKIVGDTLVMGDSEAKYAIVKQTPHLFWFKNQNGDVVKLQKSDDPSDVSAFAHEQPKVMILTEVLKRDTVVMYSGERYHCYVAINPTKYKVRRRTYNDDGVEVDNVYYDYIIHLSIFRGATQLFSRDFNKKMYSRLVPGQFLSQSILSNMTFNKVDSRGFHFDTTVCVPDGASCYLLDTKVSFDGHMSMELLEY